MNRTMPSPAPRCPHASPFYKNAASSYLCTAVQGESSAGHLIAVKLIWRSTGFRPGMESNLVVTVKPLNGASATPVVVGTTNAKLGDWAMMTGIDFPDAGCWEITGRYRGEELRFVVETVRSASL